jgi:hypothetical protein
MADERYVSIGPVQVAQVDVSNINLALAQVQEQLDQLRGLRGVTRVYNRLQVDDPQAADEALTAGAGDTAIAQAVNPVKADVAALDTRVTTVEGLVTALQETVSALSTRVTALETHLAAIIAAVPAAVSVTLLPTLTDSPASADALRDNLTSAWEPPLEANDAALAAMANGLRTALLAT